MNVFYSYAHEDAGYRQELEKSLVSLERQGLISGWSDQALLPGSDWLGEILARLEAADVILFLVSRDLISSEFIWDVELRRALERRTQRRAIVIPVIVRPADWQHTVLGSLQAVPRGGRAVTEWENQDAAWVAVAEDIRRLVQPHRDGRTAPPQRAGAATTQMLVAQAEGLLWIGRREDALATLDAAIATEPLDRETFAARARALMLRGRNGEALAAFDAILRENATDVVALIGRAQTQAALGRHPAALADLDRALKLDERQPYARYVRGFVLEASRQPDKAKKEYDRALKQDPNHVQSLIFRGYLQYRQGRHEKALSDFSKALELNPNIVLGIVGRGWAYVMLKRYGEALAEFQRALQLDPNNSPALNGQQEARRLVEDKGHLQRLFGKFS